MSARAALTACAVVFACGTAQAAALPAWARDLASRPAAESGSAVVLLDQTDLVVAADGQARSSRRYAVRLRDRAGRDAAAVQEVYVPGTDNVRLIRGWLMRADGTVRELGHREVRDVALVNNDVYNDVRVRTLSVIDEVAPGDLFLAEVEGDARLLFAQIEWPMQGRWPTAVARRSLTLPPGWRADAVMFNAPALDPRRDGATLTWELTGLPALPEEEAMPPLTDLTPRLAISIHGPDGAAAAGQFEDWGQVSAWLHDLSAGSTLPSDIVAAKARSLTKSAATEIDRVKAVAAYLQRVQYVSIQTGVGRGGGYRPRAPRLVLERNYGDCKDKAALMRAMLASVGITSHLVAIFAGDRNYVRPEWPTPQQFNHVILAVSIGQLPADVTSALEHPRFGRLLMFDPTDEHTPLGELPLHEQGSLALLVAPAGGALLRMPLAPASRHGVTRTVDGTVDERGVFAGSVRERLTGAPAVRLRARQAMLSAVEFQSSVERRMTTAMPRARLTSLSVGPDGASAVAAVALVASVEATGFAHFQADLLFLTLPFDLGERLEVPAGRRRQTAFQVDPRSVVESIRLRLPVGFDIDEMPQAVTLETTFGRYSVTYTIDSGHLIAKRAFEVPLQRILPDQYQAARAFFDRIRAADSTPVVLVRKSG